MRRTLLSLSLLLAVGLGFAAGRWTAPRPIVLPAPSETPGASVDPASVPSTSSTSIAPVAVWVIGGDQFVVEVNLRLGEANIGRCKDPIRLLGVDAAETRLDDRCKGQAARHGLTPEGVIARGEMAKSRADTLVRQARAVVLVFPPGWSKVSLANGRYAYMELDGRDLGETLLREGLAWPSFPALDHPRQERYRAAAQK